MPDNFEIIKLRPNDWSLLRDIKLRSLKDEPTAFSTTYEELAACEEGFWREQLDNPWYLFARQDSKIIAMGYAEREEDGKNKHIAMLHGVYVVPESRGHHVGRRLIERLLEELKNDPHLIKVELFVGARQDVALKMYESFGFQKVGKLDKEVFYEGKYYDEYLMQKFLKQV